MERELGIKVQEPALEPSKMKANVPKLSVSQPIPCMMYSPTTYDVDFPPMERRTDDVHKVSALPYVPPEITSSGVKSLSAPEEVLNWQTQNVVA